MATVRLRVPRPRNLQPDKLADVPIGNVFRVPGFHADCHALCQRLGAIASRFPVPFLIACNSFWDEEKKRIPETPWLVSLKDYTKLFQFNAQIAQAGWDVSQARMSSITQRAQAISGGSLPYDDWQPFRERRGLPG